MTGFIEPVALTGQQWVSLEPLTADHAPEIAAAAMDVRPLWFTSAPTPESTPEWVDGRLAVQHPDTGLTLVVRALDGEVIGSSSYCHVDPPNRRLEIGYTWYRQSVRRTGVNTECKLLMLSHAFDELN
ncbi:MAG: acetyltransferase, ribosomal protein N-acetylase, partial [Mycobacterium sp.]|nr:acetyltransferase, ribosomal protein N-acetylase [Mycobacterium sp.]